MGGELSETIWRASLASVWRFDEDRSNRQEREREREQSG